MVTKLLMAGVLLGRGLIHLGFISGRPAATAGGPEWPFELSRSWILGPLGVPTDAVHLLGTVLVVITIAAFAVAALAAVGVLPTDAWPVAIVVGGAASIAVLGLFFHPWLVAGAAIDVLLLWAVIVARWEPAA